MQEPENGKPLNPLPTENWSWIRPELAVGGRIPRRHAEILGSHFGIRRVVDLRAEEKDDQAVLHGQRLAYLHLPTPDCHAVSQEMLWQGVRWVRQGLHRGEKVLIHCEHGIGRSIMLTCCVLVSQGASPVQALRRIKQVRAIASPSPEQLHGVLTWSADWHRQNPPACSPVTWEELARIAYQSLADGYES
jgi:hypothetical protein